MFKISSFTLLLSTVFVCRAQPSNEDVWSPKLEELKSMMTTLNTKLSALDSKMSNFQLLEYAFKVNDINKHLGSLDDTVHQLSVKMDNLKDSMSTSCRPNGNKEREVQRMGSSSDNLMEKIDDYGQKATVFHSELLQMAEREQQDLGILKNVTRTGFNKLYQRVDEVLTMEGMMERMTQTMSGLSPRVTQMYELLNDINQAVLEIKFKVDSNNLILSNGTHMSGGNLGTSRSSVLRGTKTSTSRLSELIGNASQLMKDLQLENGDVVTTKDIRTLSSLATMVTLIEANYFQNPISMNTSSASDTCSAKLLSEINSVKKMLAEPNRLSQDTSKRGTGGGMPGCLEPTIKEMANIQTSGVGAGLTTKLRNVRSTISSIASDIRRNCNCNNSSSILSIQDIMG